MTIEELQDSAQPFLTLVNEFAQTCELVGIASADHLGYKCASSDEFEQMREMLESYSDYIHQSVISNRRIAIIRLTSPLVTILGEVRFLELSDQKPDGSQKSGFDHLEIFPSNDEFDALITHVQSQGEEGIASIKPHHTTHNFTLREDFILKIEPCALVQKIKDEEMD